MNLAHISRTAGEPSKILYIDDDPVNRTLVSRLLSLYNFKILEAETGLEGLDIARREHPQLILMDINMPGLDGHETTTRMRSIPALEQTPIVAVTARTTQGERELALAAGCDGYIPKPIDVDDFPHQIMAYLQGRRETITNDQRQYYLDQYSRKLVERLEQKVVELQNANRKLQKIDKLKSDFITLAAHELRTPITLIYGYARLLQMVTCPAGQTDPTGEGGVSDLAGRIFTSVHRLNETVNDILNISLIEADEMHLNCEPVNIEEVIQTTLKELNPAKHGRVLEISMEQLDALPQITADRQRVQQVFWNILSNAIKYTPDGGCIHITGRVTGSPSGPEQADQPDHGVIISVKDSGIGIDPAEHENIFERFYIVGNTDYHTSSKTAFGGGGLGLGLPIARGIVNAHSGRIWVDSPGQNLKTTPGSTFYIFLPVGGPDK